MRAGVQGGQKRALDALKLECGLLYLSVKNLNSSLLQEQYVLLIAEPPLQFLSQTSYF